ncbi:MAG: SDR family oxidoreductase [Cyclobacteriaceae bacterium]
MSKTVIITGGSSGIGQACAIEYGQKGYNIVFTGRNPQRIQETEKMLSENGIDCLGLSVDAASLKGAEVVIAKTIEKFDSIDTLICNAGISMRALFKDIDLEVFQQVMDINFMGSVNYVKCALPHLLQSKGTIVAVSSINGHRGTPARTAYTASKYAMEGFFEALRTEVMYKGVHILVVSPGFTGTNIRNTALTADGSVQGESPRDETKMMTSKEVAQTIYKGQQKKKRDIVLTTQGKLAVFLNKWMPGRMDKIVYNVMAKEPDSPFK